MYRNALQNGFYHDIHEYWGFIYVVTFNVYPDILEIDSAYLLNLPEDVCKFVNCLNDENDDTNEEKFHKILNMFP